MPEKRNRCGLGGWLFLASVIVSYGLIGLFKPEATTQAVTFYLHVMRQVLPVLGLVFILLFIANLLLEPRRIKRYLGAGAGPLILIGNAFHNFVYGFVIAATFLTSIPLGIAASLAVIAHEIPQEVGDFAILLESGYSRLPGGERNHQCQFQGNECHGNIIVPCNTSLRSFLPGKWR